MRWLGATFQTIHWRVMKMESWQFRRPRPNTDESCHYCALVTDIVNPSEVMTSFSSRQPSSFRKGQNPVSEWIMSLKIDYFDSSHICHWMSCVTLELSACLPLLHHLVEGLASSSVPIMFLQFHFLHFHDPFDYVLLSFPSTAFPVVQILEKFTKIF